MNFQQLVNTYVALNTLIAEIALNYLEQTLLSFEGLSVNVKT